MNKCKTCKKPLGVKEPIVANPKGKTAQCVPCAKNSGIDISKIQKNPGGFVPILHKAGKFVEKRTGIPMSGASIVGRIAGKKAEQQVLAAGTKLSKLTNPVIARTKRGHPIVRKTRRGRAVTEATDLRNLERVVNYVEAKRNDVQIAIQKNSSWLDIQLYNMIAGLSQVIFYAYHVDDTQTMRGAIGELQDYLPVWAGLPKNSTWKMNSKRLLKRFNKFASESQVEIPGLEYLYFSGTPVANPPRRGLKIHTKGRYYRERMHPPKQFDRFRTTKTRTGHALIHGRRRAQPNPKRRWDVQAVLHPRTPSEARKLRSRGYKFPTESNPRMRRIRGVGGGMVLAREEISSLAPGLLYMIIDVWETKIPKKYGGIYSVESHESGVNVRSGNQNAFLVLAENISRCREILKDIEKKYQYRHPASISLRRTLHTVASEFEPPIYKASRPARKVWRVIRVAFEDEEQTIPVSDIMVGDMLKEIASGEEGDEPAQITVIPSGAKVVGKITTRMDATPITTALLMSSIGFYAEISEGMGVPLEMVKSKAEKEGKEVPEQSTEELFSDDTMIAGVTTIRGHGYSPWIDKASGRQTALPMRYKEEAINWLIDHGVPIEKPDVPLPLPWEEGGENVRMTSRRPSYHRKGTEIL